MSTSNAEYVETVYCKSPTKDALHNGAGLVLLEINRVCADSGTLSLLLTDKPEVKQLQPALLIRGQKHSSSLLGSRRSQTPWKVISVLWQVQEPLGLPLNPIHHSYLNTRNFKTSPGFLRSDLKKQDEAGGCSQINLVTLPVHYGEGAHQSDFKYDSDPLLSTRLIEFPRKKYPLSPRFIISRMEWRLGRMKDIGAGV